MSCLKIVEEYQRRGEVLLVIYIFVRSLFLLFLFWVVPFGYGFVPYLLVYY